MNAEILRAEPAAIVNAPESMDIGGMIQLAQAMAASGFFANAKDANKALAVMMIGREMGIGPAAALNGINVINGKPQLGANLMAAKIKASGKYNYRVVQHTATVCEIEFFESGEPVGRSSFSVDDAQTAGYMRNPVYKSNPRNMLFARALSNGAKWYTPDAFGGIPVYHEGELEMGATERTESVKTSSRIVPSAVSHSEQERNAGLFIKRDLSMTKDQFDAFKKECIEAFVVWWEVALEAEQMGIRDFISLMRYVKEGVVPTTEEEIEAAIATADAEIEAQGEHEAMQAAMVELA